MTGSEVLIAGAEQLAPLLGEGCENLSPTELITLYAGKMRLIPYSAVGTQSGLLPAFRPDSLTVDSKAREDILVAISPTAVSGDGFDCII